MKARSLQNNFKRDTKIALDDLKAEILNQYAFN